MCFIISPKVYVHEIRGNKETVVCLKHKDMEHYYQKVDIIFSSGKRVERNSVAMTGSGSRRTDEKQVTTSYKVSKGVGVRKFGGD